MDPHGTIGCIHHHPNGITPRLPGAIKEDKTMDSCSSTNPLTTVNNPTPWAYQEQPHYQEEFLPQPEGPSELELPMATFTGHSPEPCYTPQPDPNYELRLLMEHFARDSERSCSRMDLCTQAYRETEEILLSIKKCLDDIEKSYAQ
ncbi:unnamed protein product [Linum trigynum]|uniref:Uncharacterized protein n=1 Tax=Linum trigynum TaxID=586398 RepID=A0AAV2GJX4_9ROSI